MTEVGQLMEVILYVEDMSAQARFYCDTLGLKVEDPLGAQHLDELYWVELDTRTCTPALHAGRQRRFGADAPKIVIGVNDTAALRDDLLLRGVLMDEIRIPRPGIMVCDGIDPEGNRFSVETRKPVKA